MARPPPRLGCSERGLLGPPRFPHACPRASSKRLPLRKHVCVGGSLMWLGRQTTMTDDGKCRYEYSYTLWRVLPSSKY